jgi:hypothetical protein
MYSPLNEYLVLQQNRSRKDDVVRHNREAIAARAGRRWWRRAAHRAG